MTSMVKIIPIRNLVEGMIIVTPFGDKIFDGTEIPFRTVDGQSVFVRIHIADLGNGVL